MPFVMYGYPWDMSTETVVASAAADPENLHAGQLVVSGETVFWGTATLHRTGINVWDPQGGARPFIRWVGDYTRGAGDLGTDGVDLVWGYGEGKLPNDTNYPVASIMTAPFTNDPTALQARRLRSLPHGRIGGNQFEVGCGHAAYSAWDDILVIRLSDGWSWVVPNTTGQIFFYAGWTDVRRGIPLRSKSAATTASHACALIRSAREWLQISGHLPICGSTRAPIRLIRARVALNAGTRNPVCRMLVLAEI